MTNLLTVLSIIILLALGILIGKSTIRFTSKYFDFCLIALIVISTWIGKDTHLLKIFDFELIFSTSLKLFLLGIFAARILFLYKWAGNK